MEISEKLFSFSAPHHHSPEHRVTVLLVDDQEIMAESIRAQLSGERCIDLHCCFDGASAAQLASDIKPTVILQDLVMPGMDGFSLVRQYRQTSATRNIPIIVLSGKEEPETKSRAFSIGANDYLVKPPETVELIARIYHHSRSYLNQIERDEAYQALRESRRQLMEGNLALTELTEKLRRNNLALQDAERLARIGSWSWDFSRDRTLWSDTLYEMFLWDVAKPPPSFQDLSLIFTPESFHMLRAAVEQCAKSGTSYSIELEAIRSSGERFFVHARGEVARNVEDLVVSMFGTVHDVTEQRKLAEIAQKSAVLEERTRIASEIHDSLAQSFAAIVLQSEMAEEQAKQNNLPGSQATIGKIRESARFGLAEARRSVLSLHPSRVLHAGLVHAIQQLSQRASVQDLLVCGAEITGRPRRLHSHVEHELFRVAQEALNNAVRHARANRIFMQLHFRPKEISMVVKDNGGGFSLEGVRGKEGFGLPMMRQRAEKAGGTLAIRSQQGKGTEVVVTIADPDLSANPDP